MGYIIRAEYCNFAFVTFENECFYIHIKQATKVYKREK